MTCAARCGACNASHSRNSAFNSKGRRSTVYPAHEAPACAACSSTASMSRSFNAGMIGATSTPTGMPASASVRFEFRGQMVVQRIHRYEHLHQPLARHGYKNVQIAFHQRVLGDDGARMVAFGQHFERGTSEAPA